jgi:hypothetical protein
MIKELRVGNYVAYKGKPSLVCALDYDPKLRKENISVVYKWGEPPYKTNGDIQPILLTEKLVLQCGFNQLDDYTLTMMKWRLHKTGMIKLYITLPLMLMNIR